MDVKFKYEFGGKCPFGPIYRPVAKVLLRSPKLKTWTKVWLVVDSGADFSILPKYVSQDLGISLEKDCVKNTTSGVGGEQTIYLSKTKVEAKIGRIKRNIPLAFFDNDEVPALLGRLGFMETFDTEFLKSKTVIFRDR